MSRPALALALLVPAAAFGQELVEVPLDCDPTAGGVQCRIAAVESEGLLYCVAYGADGAPVANTTVASDDGLAALNGVRVEEIASMSCRVE